MIKGFAYREKEGSKEWPQGREGEKVLKKHIIPKGG